jgi:hypothetical protein
MRPAPLPPDYPPDLPRRSAWILIRPALSVVSAVLILYISFLTDRGHHPSNPSDLSFNDSPLGAFLNAAYFRHIHNGSDNLETCQFLVGMKEGIMSLKEGGFGTVETN